MPAGAGFDFGVDFDVTGDVDASDVAGGVVVGRALVVVPAAVTLTLLPVRLLPATPLPVMLLRGARLLLPVSRVLVAVVESVASEATTVDEAAAMIGTSFPPERLDAHPDNAIAIPAATATVTAERRPPGRWARAVHSLMCMCVPLI